MLIDKHFGQRPAPTSTGSLTPDRSAVGRAGLRPINTITLSNGEVQGERAPIWATTCSPVLPSVLRPEGDDLFEAADGELCRERR